MSDHDDSTEHSISGGIRRYPGDLTDGHRIRRPGARLHLGHLGVTGYVQGLAERASRFVRCGLEHVARQHCTHGVGFLSAVRTPRWVPHRFGGVPGIHNRGRPRYLGEKTMMMKTAKRVTAAVGLLAISATQSVWAALPTPVAPSTAPAAGDWIALIKGYIKDGGLVLGLAIAVIGFLWIAYLGFAKFNEARQGKAEWAEVGVLGIVGAIVLIFASFLLTEAAGVI